jgi:hypothetical protein
MHLELLKPHTHQGRRLSAGDRLELPEASARWLIDQGAARVAASTGKPLHDTATRSGRDPNTSSGD